MGMLDYGGVPAASFADALMRSYSMFKGVNNEDEKLAMQKKLQDAALAEKALQLQREESFAADAKNLMAPKTTQVPMYTQEPTTGMMQSTTPEGLTRYENDPSQYDPSIAPIDKSAMTTQTTQPEIGIKDLLDLSIKHSYKPEETMKALATIMQGNTAQDKLTNAMTLKMMSDATTQRGQDLNHQDRTDKLNNFMLALLPSLIAKNNATANNANASADKKGVISDKDSINRVNAYIDKAIKINEDSTKSPLTPQWKRDMNNDAVKQFLNYKLKLSTGEMAPSDFESLVSGSGTPSSSTTIRYDNKGNRI